MPSKGGVHSHLSCSVYVPYLGKHSLGRIACM